jgi:hypothetical protein
MKKKESPLVAMDDGQLELGSEARFALLKEGTLFNHLIAKLVEWRILEMEAHSISNNDAL